MAKMLSLLVCDDIRKEVNDKTTIVGIYDQGLIVVPQFPASIQKLCFYMKMGELKGSYKFSCHLEAPGAPAELPEHAIVRQQPIAIPEGNDTGTFNVIAPGLEVTQPGPHLIVVTMEGEEGTVRMETAVMILSPDQFQKPSEEASAVLEGSVE